MSAQELSDYRSQWLVNKDMSYNQVVETSKQSVKKKVMGSGAWLTSAEISKIVNRPVAELADLLKGLKKQPSHFSHLRADRSWDEYWYIHGEKVATSKENESSMAASAQVEPENTDMLAAIHDDLGVGGHDWNDLLPAHGQSPKPKGKAKAKAKAKQPTAPGSPGKAQGSAPKPEVTLPKLEVQGESLLKQSRQMLVDLEVLLAKKPYLKGLG